MALKAVHVSDVPNLDQVPETAALSLCSNGFSASDGDGEDKRCAYKFPKFVVMGHRGSGMNMFQSSDSRMKYIKENSILSFNAAANFLIDYIEFDVQVTKDDYPVIFHDTLLFTEDDKGTIVEKRVTELTLAEFLSYGPQKEPGNVGKPLYRKTKDGMIFEWKVEKDDRLCTLQEAFEEVNNSVGFNIELKFDDHIVYKEEQLGHVLQVVLKVVSEHAKNRPLMFSSFQPDAALLMRKLQSTYPVFFLTNGGSEIYADVRRNSLDEAIKVCLAGGLQGIVSEVKAIFRNPGAVARIKENKLSLLTYGQLNNVREVVFMQRIMGVEGVIVDLVENITEAVSDFVVAKENDEANLITERKDQKLETKPPFSKDDLSLLLKHKLELIQV